MTIVKQLSTITGFLIYITVLSPMIYANKTNFNLHCCHAFLLSISTGATVNKEIETLKMDGNVNKNKLTVFWLVQNRYFSKYIFGLPPKHISFVFSSSKSVKCAIGLPDH